MLNNSCKQQNYFCISPEDEIEIVLAFCFGCKYISFLVIMMMFAHSI